MRLPASPFVPGVAVQPEHKAAFLEAISRTGSCAIRVEGKSMWPFIRSGDLVTIVPCKKIPVIGSVAAVFNNDQCIVHRVVKRCKRSGAMGEVWICGDSSPGSQSRIPPGEIVGIVSLLERNGTRHTCWLRPPLSLAALLIGRIMRALIVIRDFFGK
jgi:hypothetical protein